MDSQVCLSPYRLFRDSERANVCSRISSTNFSPIFNIFVAGNRRQSDVLPATKILKIGEKLVKEILAQ
jgi:hypothetical protein